MRIGITTHFQFSIFSGGGASTVISVAETLKRMGHDITLINLTGSATWWDDLQSLKSLFSTVCVDDIKEPSFDLVLEVAMTLPSAEVRRRISKNCVWVVRKPLLLGDIENTIFPVSMTKRDTEGISAVWCFDQEVTRDEYQYLETLTRVPVYSVPFVWTPSIIEVYRKEAGHSSWIQSTVGHTQQQQKVLPWSIHICETNNTATSSCTIPIVTLYEAKRQGKLFFNKYKIHNIQQIENSKFFKENVLAHVMTEDLSGDFQGRQRIADWTMDPMSCVLSHMRFRKIRPYIFDTVWSGIPLVHNSPLLRELSEGTGYEGYYYTDNSIVDSVAALVKLQDDLVGAKGMFSQMAQATLQQRILDQYSPISGRVQEGWRIRLEGLSAPPAPTAVVPLPVAAPAPTAVVPTVVAVPLPTALAAPATGEAVRILFTDMWDDFNPAYNMFTLMLEEAMKNLPNPVPVEGYSLDTFPSDQKPSFLFFGPFGSEWKNERFASMPKVHFTGENTLPINQPEIFLNLGFPHADFVDERYIRLPLWMLEIDWFNCDVEKIRNPKPLPLDDCFTVKPLTEDRNRFCAFVVTNPCNPVRNNAFQWLSQYKRVDSAGRLFNNVGDEIFAGLGGGGGELKKHNFLKKYKFCLAYENASSQGYTTEKLLHAKAAGCIPIYWGDPKVERDFDTKGLIDARRFTSPEELIEAVRKIDENPELYEAMRSIPAVDEYKRDIVRRTFSQITLMMLKVALPERQLTQNSIPRFLGSISTVTSVSKPSIKTAPLVITMATNRFLPSLYQQLSGLKAQRPAVPGLEAIVWLGDDVSAEVEASIKEGFDFVKFMRFPTETPAFPDFWAPEHFAWKLWILNSIAMRPDVMGRLVLYMDSGVFLSRWPKSWLTEVEKHGISLLEDPRQQNYQWCHETFCKALGVTEKEKQEQQLWAGSLAFVGGSDKANRLFSEAYEWAKKREVIVGPKWAGVLNGKPFGHRHDQSILSILSSRLGISRFPMDEIYCDHSLRKTFLSGKALYVHRGAFTVHKPFMEGIDDAYVINLDKRPDRMEKLYGSNPELKDRVQRISAVNGREMTLTPRIARMFKPHDFFWKKAIMGCALSHLTLWWQLLTERPEIENYLILEDDVKLQPNWQDRWNEAKGYIPEDYDVVYLGGILPPNRAGFEHTKEKVNNYFSRVAPNQFFGQRTPNRYFHWCAYAYVLSRAGAQKILQRLMDSNGYWTSADHMICNPVDEMNLYFLDPLVAGCYQDDDPKYRDSSFNDFNRVDGFDSDLWNNDDRFTAEEVQSMMNDERIDIARTLEDARSKSVVASRPETKSIVITEDVIGSPESPKYTQQDAFNYISEWTPKFWGMVEKVEKLRYYSDFLCRSALPRLDPSSEKLRELLEKWRAAPVDTELWRLVEKKLLVWSEIQGFNSPLPVQQKRRILALDRHKFDSVNAHERDWLKELLGPDQPFSVETFTDSDDPTDQPIVIIQRPWIQDYAAIFRRWNAKGLKFYILHLSDEYVGDRIDFYEMESCLGVVRMYQRSLPESVKSKVCVIPLGYHWTLEAGSDDPLNKTPRLPFREKQWSFFGTDWKDRRSLLSPLGANQPYLCYLVDSWDSEKKVQRKDYITSLLDSIFVPCPPGLNPETFRLYEALECGCVPLYVKQGSDPYADWLQEEIGLLPVSNWQEASALLAHFVKEKEILENYRGSLLNRWVAWKSRLRDGVRRTFGL
jgi:GR25 family glycosyltransferase involved in LPS biosynthesis/glycosyltransferase involved in cell wall biosynthesis